MQLDVPERRGELVWCCGYGQKMVSLLPPGNIICSGRFCIYREDFEEQLSNAIMGKDMKEDN